MRLFHSLKNILTANFVLVATLPVLIIGLSALQILTASMEEEITQKNLLLAQSLTAEIEYFLEEPLRLLRQIEYVVVQKALIPHDQINAYLASVIVNYQFFEMLMILDPKGKVTYLAPYNEDFRLLDMSGQDFFQVTSETSYPYWSPTFISLQTGSPTLTVSIPLNQGMLVGYLNLALLNATIAKVKIGASGYATISDRDGTVIAHPNHTYVSQRLNIRHLDLIQQGIQGDKGSVEYAFQGVMYLGSIAMVPQTRWIVGVIQPLAEAYAPVQRIRAILLAGTFLALLFAVVVAVFSLRKTLSPLTQLTEHAQHIIAGQYQPLPLQDHYQEVDELTRTFNVMFDVIKTRENALRESETRYRALVENLPDIIMRFDRDGRHLFVSHSVENVVTLHAHDFIGKTHRELGFPEEQCRFWEQHIHSVFETGNSVETEFEIEGPQGAIIFNWRLFPETDPVDQITSVLSISRDITEQKQAEEQIYRLNAELEDRVRRRTIELERTNRELQYFVQAASHDLKTPLRGIGRQASWLVEDYASFVDERGKELTALLITQVKRLDRLLDGMLEYSNIGRSARHEAPIQLHTLVLGIITDLSPPEHVHIRIEDQLPVISGNRTWLYKVFFHLLKNAIQAINSPQGYIGIQCVDQGDSWLFRIADNGQGIEAKYHTKIFQFFQTLNRHDTHEHIGIGLAVVKKIVELYGGEIWVESVPGEGSIFWFTFPKKETAE